jgi:hypothetical protein
MADHDDGDTKAIAQLNDQVVESFRGDRIEASRWFIQKQHAGVERQRARDADAPAHAAAEFGRHRGWSHIQADKR